MPVIVPPSFLVWPYVCLAGLSHGHPKPPHCRAPQSLAPLAALFTAVQPSLNPPHPLLCPKSTTETVQLTSKNQWSVRDRPLLIFVFYRGLQEATGVDTMKDT